MFADVELAVTFLNPNELIQNRYLRRKTVKMFGDIQAVGIEWNGAS